MWPTLSARYGRLLDHVHVLRDSFGLNAAIYTQTADVETECNGLMTYDRAISKLDPVVLQTASHAENPEKLVRVIVPDAIYGRVTWKYTTTNPGENWQSPDFDDSAWKKGAGGFGTEGLTPGAIVGTTGTRLTSGCAASSRSGRKTCVPRKSSGITTKTPRFISMACWPRRPAATSRPTLKRTLPAPPPPRSSRA